jgi:hypothetical protein
MDAECVLFNGVDGATGQYLRPPVSLEEVASRLALETPEREIPHREILAGRDPRDLAQAGWGVLFGPRVGREVVEALAPLLRHRRAQAGRREALYQEYRVEPGETARRFLTRWRSAPGAVDPRKLPYYLLLVADPQDVSFRFQYRLDLQHAVGRLWLDSPADFARYARTVVELETDPPRPAGRRVAMFGPRRDEATHLSAGSLVEPLADALESTAGWALRRVLGPAATKAGLRRLLGGDDTPNVLFTAGHGVGFPKDHPHQPTHQGALLCQDWTGPGTDILPDHYLRAADVSDDAGVRGLLSFHFACYSAGTPEWDGFAAVLDGKKRRLATKAFVAPLAQRLLAHPGGSALALVGHVDQAFHHSFAWDRRGPDVETYVSFFARLLAGFPVGAAMEHFAQRYGEIAAELAAELEDAPDKGPRDKVEVARLWVAHHDARNYVVLGDPAVRLPGFEQGVSR